MKNCNFTHIIDSIHCVGSEVDSLITFIKNDLTNIDNSYCISNEWRYQEILFYLERIKKLTSYELS